MSCYHLRHTCRPSSLHYWNHENSCVQASHRHRPGWFVGQGIYRVDSRGWLYHVSSDPAGPIHPLAVQCLGEPARRSVVLRRACVRTSPQKGNYSYMRVEHAIPDQPFERHLGPLQILWVFFDKAPCLVSSKHMTSSFTSNQRVVLQKSHTVSSKFKVQTYKISIVPIQQSLSKRESSESSYGIYLFDHPCIS